MTARLADPRLSAPILRPAAAVLAGAVAGAAASGLVAARRIADPAGGLTRVARGSTNPAR